MKVTVWKLTQNLIPFGTTIYITKRRKQVTFYYETVLNLWKRWSRSQMLYMGELHQIVTAVKIYGFTFFGTFVWID